MIAKVYCERCKKYEDIEIEDLDDAMVDSPNIPSPNANGLKTYSIVHNDHILNVDIDNNGDVRSYKIINRIGHNLEKIISSVSYKLLKYINSDSPNVKTLVIVTKNLKLRNLIISIANQLLMSIDDDKSAMLTVSSENTIFEFGNIQIYIGEWKSKVLNLQSDQALFAYHLNSDTADYILDKIRTGLEEGYSDYYSILFDTNFIKSDTWKNVLEEIIQPNPQIIISDVGTSQKAAISISILVDKLFQIDQ